MEKDKRKVTLNNQDKDIIRAIEPIVDGIAKIFGDNCEVVLHSLEDTSKSVVKIENGHVTGRQLGAPLTDLGIKILEDYSSTKNNVYGSYYIKHADGRPFKGISICITNSNSKPIAFLCINVDLSLPLIGCLKELFSDNIGSSNSETEHFSLNVEELVIQKIKEILISLDKRGEFSPYKKNKSIVEELYKASIFKMSGAIDLTAKILKISRYTVYNYIREVKHKIKDKE